MKNDLMSIVLGNGQEIELLEYLSDSEEAEMFKGLQNESDQLAFLFNLLRNQKYEMTHE